jgi:hypothetical protein
MEDWLGWVTRWGMKLWVLYAVGAVALIAGISHDIVPYQWGVAGLLALGALAYWSWDRPSRPHNEPYRTEM